MKSGIRSRPARLQPVWDPESETAGKDRKGNTINKPHVGEFGHHYALDKSAAIPDGDREEVFARLKERLGR